MNTDHEHNGHTGSAFGEHSERIATTDGRDGEEFLNRCCQDNGINLASAMNLYAWFDENMPLRQNEGVNTDARGEHFWRRALMAVFSYQGPKAFALECFVLALGTATKQTVWFDIIGCRTQVELADRWKVTKANVEKCVGNIQDALNLPGERGETARANMSRAREGQLKTTSIKPQPEKPTKDYGLVTVFGDGNK